MGQMGVGQSDGGPVHSWLRAFGTITSRILMAVSSGYWGRLSTIQRLIHVKYAGGGLCLKWNVEARYYCYSYCN